MRARPLRQPLLLSLGLFASTAFLAGHGPAYASLTAPNRPSAPAKNPQGIPNRFWHWRGCRLRYQVLGEENEGPALLFVHGLFVNADHWRRNLPALADAGYRVYAVDLLGSGYSDKPAPDDAEAAELNGERNRELAPVSAELSTRDGALRTAEVPLKHPHGSFYNFYTWSEQVADFAREVVKSERTILVGNSVGSVVSLQAASDAPELFGGVMLVNPRFREEHVAEASPLARPVVGLVQSLLRETPVGSALFGAAANKETVKTILEEPYFDKEQVTEELVDVLLAPLLTEGAKEVVFDTLAYSTGPLLEQILQEKRIKAPVWVCWGKEDPWTPEKRVDSLERFGEVERIEAFEKVGHCPHDEAPEVFNELMLEFAAKVRRR